MSLKLQWYAVNKKSRNFTCPKKSSSSSFLNLFQNFVYDQCSLLLSSTFSHPFSTCNNLFYKILTCHLGSVNQLSLAASLQLSDLINSHFLLKWSQASLEKVFGFFGKEYAFVCLVELKLLGSPRAASPDGEVFQFIPESFSLNIQSQLSCNKY